MLSILFFLLLIHNCIAYERAIVRRVIAADTLHVQVQSAHVMVRVLGYDAFVTSPTDAKIVQQAARAGLTIKQTQEKARFAHNELHNMLTNTTVVMYMDPYQPENDEFECLLRHVVIDATRVFLSDLIMSYGWGLPYIPDSIVDEAIPLEMVQKKMEMLSFD